MAKWAKKVEFKENKRFSNIEILEKLPSIWFEG
jgi:hypothetical protein